MVSKVTVIDDEGAGHRGVDTNAGYDVLKAKIGEV